MEAIYLFALKKLSEASINSQKKRRETLKMAMGIKVPDYNLKGMPLVNNIRAGRAISQAFNDKQGGVKVVAAPPGSGKTTYIRSSMNSFIDSGGKARMLASEFRKEDDFYAAFGGEDNRLILFDILPLRSLIVIDQLEHFRPLPTEIEGLILHLACESCRTAECNVLISVSDSTLATKVLDINGLHKIKAAGRATDFRWGKEEVATFINHGCVNWSEENNVMFAHLGMLAGSPAFMNSVLCMFPSGLPSDIKSIRLNAMSFDRRWTEFEECGL